MKKLKTFLILACSLVLSTFSLVGCFSDGSSSSDGSSVNTPTSSEAPTSSETPTSSEATSSEATSSDDASSEATSSDDSSAHVHTGEYVYVSNGDGTHTTKYACCNVVKNEYDVCEGGEADCENAAVCDKCQTAYGEALGHEGGEATCKTKAICTVCEQPYGEFDATNHESTAFNYVSNGDGTHTKEYACCGADVETEDCAGGTATCTAAAVCTVCETAYGDKLAHYPGENEVTDAGETHSFLCAGCNETQSGAHDYVTPDYDETQHWNVCICGKEGEKTAHKYAYVQEENQHKQVCDCGHETALEDCTGDATCMEAKPCTVCGNDYTDADNHALTADEAEWTAGEGEYAGFNVKACACGHVFETFDVTNEKVTEVDLGIEYAEMETTAELYIGEILDEKFFDGTVAIKELSDILYNGESVIESFNDSERSIPATIFGNAYGRQYVSLIVSGEDEAEHEIKVAIDLVTNVITTASELKVFLDVADYIEDDLTAEGAYTGRAWGGYFKLGADITLNTTNKFDNGGFYVWNYDMDRKAGDGDASYSEGFVGIFDGCGYAINGLAMSSTAFIDVIGANGVLRNVALNNAVVTGGASVISEQVNGLVENVYVSMYSVGGWFNDSGAGLGQYGSWYDPGWSTANTTIVNNSWTATGTLRNVIINVADSARETTQENAYKGKTWQDDADGPRLLGLSVGAKFEGVYLIGVPEEGAWATTAAGIINGVKASEAEKKTENRGWYVDMATFKANLANNATAQAAVNALPLLIQYSANLINATKIAGVQTLNLDVQVDDTTKAVSLGTGNVTLDVSKVEGKIEKVLMNGSAVNYTVEGTNVVMAKSQFGWSYGEKSIAVFTDKGVYEISAILATKVIMNKTDLNNFGYIAKAVRSDNDKMWGGYFMLGDNIEYNDTWKSFIAVGPAVKGNSTGAALSWGYAAGGFEGVFNGNGYKIIGMAMSGWVDSNVHAFIGVLKGGTIKNLAFINARLTAAGALVTLGGTGTVENVYVKYEQFIAPMSNLPDTAQTTEGMGTFFHQAAGSNHVCAITLKNCFIDLTTAYLGSTAGDRAAGVIGSLNKYQANQGWQGAADYTGTMTNVYAVGNAKNFPVVFETDPANSVVSAAELGNTKLFENKEAFEAAYATDTTLKATYDSLVALFGLNA